MPQETLPGEDLIASGLDDLERGVESVAALLRRLANFERAAACAR